MEGVAPAEYSLPFVCTLADPILFFYGKGHQGRVTGSWEFHTLQSPLVFLFIMSMHKNVTKIRLNIKRFHSSIH